MQLEDILSGFLARTPDAVIVAYRGKDDATRICYVNEGVCDLFGYTEAQLIGQTPEKLHHPADWQNFLASIEPYFERNVSKFRADAGCARSDGTTFWASLSLCFYPHDESGGRFSFAVYRDISDLKRREDEANQALKERDLLLQEKETTFAKLEETQSRLVSAIDAHAGPFVIYDKNMRLVTSNRAYRASMSHDPDLIKPGMHVADVLDLAIDKGAIAVPKGDRKTYIQNIIDRAFAGVGVEDLELEGDQFQRVLRSVASNGDFVSLRLDVTELVHQRRAAEAARAQFVSAINAYPDPFSIYDKDQRLVICNDAYRSSMANDPDDIQTGMRIVDVLSVTVRDGKMMMPKNGLGQFVAEKTRMIEDGVTSYDIEFSDDIHHRAFTSKTPTGDIVAFRLDISELTQQRRALEMTQNRFMSAIGAFPDPVSIYDSDLNLVVWNPAFAASVTDDPDDIHAGMHVTDVLRMTAYSGRILPAIGREEEWVSDYTAVDLRSVAVEEFEYSDGTFHQIVRSLTDQNELLVMQFDVTASVRQRRALEENARQLEKVNAEVTHKAMHDELTGLGNRRYLGERFEKLKERRQLDGGELIALHIDLDWFKQINDTHGHGAGDHVLKTVAKRLKKRVRADDTVARIGGDEFVILLWEPGPTDRPVQLAQRIVDDMAVPTDFEGVSCRFGASVGLACSSLADVEGLLTYSDIALYKAKRAGRNQVGVFDKIDARKLRNPNAD